MTNSIYKAIKIVTITTEDLKKYTKKCSKKVTVLNQQYSMRFNDTDYPEVGFFLKFFKTSPVYWIKHQVNLKETTGKRYWLIAAKRKAPIPVKEIIPTVAKINKIAHK